MTRPRRSAATARLVTLVAVAAGAAATGCLGLGGRSAPPTRYYSLSAPVSVAERATPRAPAVAIAVEELRADAPYDERRIVRRSGRYRVGYDDDNQWAAAPGVLVADYLRRAYQASGRFGLVLSEPSTDSTAILGGRILAFEEATRGRGRAARIALDLELRDAETGRILWTRRAEQEIALQGAAPEALAAALSRALAHIAAETSAAIAAATAQARTANTRRTRS